MRSRAFTLVEMLVSTALSLLLIFVLAQGFATLSVTVRTNRSMLEIAGQMRGTMMRLQSDLENVSVPAVTWQETGAGLGCLEINEGPATDINADTVSGDDWAQVDANTSLGDTDDVLIATVRSSGAPFVGQLLGTLTAPVSGNGRLVLAFNPAAPTRTTITSNVAEIVWWTTLNDNDGDGVYDVGETFKIHQRTLLIRPDIDLALSVQTAQFPHVFFVSGNDLSFRYNGAGVRLTNSLADMTNRGSRFAHLAAFPHRLDRSFLLARRNVWAPGPDSNWGVSGTDDDGVNGVDDIGEAGTFGSDDVLISDVAGQDVMLTNVLAFDIKVYDPLAPLRIAPTGIELLSPDDAGFKRYGTATVGGAGAFVDIGYATGLPYSLPYASYFSGLPHVKSQLVAVPGFPVQLVYDTWSMDYERDGLDQNGNGVVDEGTNGFDDDGLHGADDHGERETLPPYPVALRGIQVRVRVLEPDTRQVRQETVTSSLRSD